LAWGLLYLYHNNILRGGIIMPAEKRSLVRAVEGLKQAVQSPTTQRGKSWTDRVEQALVVVEQSVWRHRANLKDDKGQVVDVDSSLNPSPVVARRAEGLDQDLDALLQEVQLLRRKVRDVHPGSASTTPDTAAGMLPFEPETAGLADFGVFCERVTQLLEHFKQFDEAEAALIQESVTMDLGAGD
jgi:hypothetical protein